MLEFQNIWLFMFSRNPLLLSMLSRFGLAGHIPTILGTGCERRLAGCPWINGLKLLPTSALYLYLLSVMETVCWSARIATIVKMELCRWFKGRLEMPIKRSWKRTSWSSSWWFVNGRWGMPSKTGLPVHRCTKPECGF